MHKLFKPVFITSILGICLLLSACARAPYNDFRPHYRTLSGGGLGALTGVAATAAVDSSLSTGFTLGGALGLMAGAYMDSREGLMVLLARKGVQIIHYGDIVTMIVPTDRLFVFDSAELNELAHPTLNDIVKFIKTYHEQPIHIAGFTGDGGTDRDQDSLSFDRAQMIKTFLWANGLELERLKASGYGAHFPLADNRSVIGSAYNRRVEIQWRTRHFTA